MEESLDTLAQRILEGTALLQGITLPHGELHCYAVKKGRFITGIDGQAIACVLKGQVDIFSTAPDGNHIYLSSAGQGNFFGVSNLFAQHALQTQLKAKTTVQLAYLPREAFVKLMQNNPELAVRYATLCNEKIQFLLDRIAQLTIQSARQKVGVFLLQASQKPQPTALPARDTLASFLGISRAALFRELAYFKEIQAIAITGNQLTILQPSCLEQYCI